MDEKDKIITELKQEIIQLREEIRLLKEDIARLEKDSGNSSKPPSSDIVKPKKTKRKVSRKKRKRGGQVVQNVEIRGYGKNSMFYFNRGVVGSTMLTAVEQETAKEPRAPLLCTLHNGEGGIRTRGAEKPHTGFRNQLLKPLGHLSKIIKY